MISLQYFFNIVTTLESILCMLSGFRYAKRGWRGCRRQYIFFWSNLCFFWVCTHFFVHFCTILLCFANVCYFCLCFGLFFHAFLVLIFRAQSCVSAIFKLFATLADFSLIIIHRQKLPTNNFSTLPMVVDHFQFLSWTSYL